MKITLEEIARVCGVSKATVSRVINNVQEGVSDSTRKRIQEVLVSMNYDTNLTIVNNRNVRTHTIGLIVPDICNPFFAELARVISITASEFGYSVYLGTANFSLKTETTFISSFISKKIDGMILVSTDSQLTETHQMLSKYNIPCLLLDRDVIGMQRCAIVVSDNAKASYNCCDMLIRSGAKNIVYVSGSASTSTALERFQGYKTALKKRGIPFDPRLIIQGDYTIESGYKAVLQLESAGIEYSALLAGNDLMAIGAIKALKELDYKIPEDIQIIGFDNIVYSQHIDPLLTTVQQPSIEMGTVAVKTLIDVLEGKNVSERYIRVMPKLFRRNTTRKVEGES